MSRIRSDRQSSGLPVGWSVFTEMVASEAKGDTNKKQAEHLKPPEAQKETAAQSDATTLSQNTLKPGDPALKVLTHKTPAEANTTGVHHLEITGNLKDKADDKHDKSLADKTVKSMNRFDVFDTAKALPLVFKHHADNLQDKSTPLVFRTSEREAREKPGSLLYKLPEAGERKVLPQEPAKLPGERVMTPAAQATTSATDKAIQSASAPAPAAPAADRLDARAVESAAEKVKDALNHRGWFLQDPQSERMRNILEPLKEADRKQVEQAYEKQTGHKLREDMAKILGPKSEEYVRLTGILNRKDGQSDEATNLAVQVDRVNSSTESLRFRDATRSSTMMAAGEGAMGVGLANAFSDMKDAGNRQDGLNELQRTIGNMTAANLEEMKRQTGKDFQRELNANPNLTKDEKDALNILFKGVDKRNGNDAESVKNVQDLAEIALRTKDAGLLRDALSTASPEARAKFLQADGVKRIDAQFSGEDQKSLTDYATRGTVDVARRVNENEHWYRTGRKEIERLVNTATDEQREQFKEDLDSGRVKITAGNDREKALWEAKLRGDDKLTADLLESHKDGFVFGWGAKTDQGKLFGAVENMSEKDWDRLKADKNGLSKIDRALETFATKEERTAIMAKLTEKLSAPDYNASKEVGNRTAKEVFNNENSSPAERLNSISHMTADERRQYRLNEGNSRTDLDRMVEKNTNPGLEREEAKRLLGKVLAGAKPDSFDKAIAESLSDNDPAKVARQIQQGFAANPEMLARLQSPSNPQDKQLRANLEQAMDRAVDKAGFGSTTIPTGEFSSYTTEGRYNEFKGDLFSKGSMPLNLQVELAQDKMGKLEAIANASPEERARLVNPAKTPADSLFQSSVSGDFDKTLVANIASQGRLTDADRMHAFATGSGGPTDEIKANLQRMTPEQRQTLANEYFTKYNKLVTDDFIGKVPDQEKFRFRDLLSPTDVNVRQIALNTREENLRHSSVFDPILNKYWENSQQGAVEAQTNMDRFVKEHARDIESLSPENKRKFNEAVNNYQTALKNYIDSKGQFAEGVVDAGITVAAVGGSVFTGGASFGLLATVGAGGAAFRVAGMRAIQGTDFEGSAQNVARQAFKGFTAAELGFISPQALGLKGIVKVGDNLATQTAEKVLARATTAGIPETAFKQGAQATENLIAQSVSGVTRQTAIAGSKELEQQAGQIAGKVLTDAATPAQRELVQQAIQQELKEQVTQNLRNKVINEAEQALTNVGFASGSNVATEVAATVVGFEDPNTLIERATSSAAAGAVGASIFHVAFKGVGAGAKAVLGRDGGGVFAGEGTVVRHADGTHSVVPEGGKYRFQPGETVATTPVEGATGTSIKLETADALARRTEVTHGKLTENGQTRDIVFHGPEYNNGSHDAALTAQRLTAEKTAARLNKEIGYESNYPEARAYTAQVDGKPVKGFIQENAGRPISDEIKEAVVKRFGRVDRMDQDLPRLLEEQPQLKRDLINSAVERVVNGDMDINTTNITRGADGKLHNIDAGHSFQAGAGKELNTYRQNLMEVGLMKGLSDQPIPAETRAKLQAFADKYKTPESIDRLAAETGAPRQHIQDSVERARQLAQDGKLPPAKSDIVDDDNVSWWRAAAASEQKERGLPPTQDDAVAGRAAEKPVLERPAAAEARPLDVDGRPVGDGHRDRLSKEWGSLNQQEIQASREQVLKDFQDFKILDGNGKAMSVQDVFDGAAKKGLLTEEGMRDVNTALAVVREHYTGIRHNGQILPDQAANWTHTMGELARVIQSAEINKLSPQETKLALMASMFSDSAKYADTAVTKGNFHTHHLDGAISANLHNLNLTDVERNIVTNAILAHQIAPPEFMGKLYYMKAAGYAKSLPEGSPERVKLEELLDPSKSPYLGRSQEGMPTFKFIQDVATREAQHVEGQGYVLKLNEDEKLMLRATGNEEWHVPRPKNENPEEFAKLPPAERERIITMNRVTNALLAGDNAQYGTLDSTYKFVVIRGPGTFFQDQTVFDSIKSIKQSFDDAFNVLSPADQQLAAANLKQTQAAFQPGNDVRARMDQAIKDEFGTTDVTFYTKPFNKADYPKISPQDQGKLNDMAKRYGDKALSAADKQKIVEEGQTLTGLTAPQVIANLEAIRVKNVIARTLRMEASMDPANVSDDFKPVRGGN